MYARQVRQGWDGWGNQYPGTQPANWEVLKDLTTVQAPKAPAKKAANDARAKAKVSSIKRAAKAPAKGKSVVTVTSRTRTAKGNSTKVAQHDAPKMAA